jgi:hypothetical protein
MERQANCDWNLIGWFRIKVNVYVKDSTRGDQHNFERLGVPSDQTH